MLGKYLHSSPALTDFESANPCMVHLRRKPLDGGLVPRAWVRLSQSCDFSLHAITHTHIAIQLTLATVIYSLHSSSQLLTKMTSKLPNHMHPCSQQLNYNPSSYHLHASFMAKFILCGRTHTLSYIPYCASCYFSGFLTDIYTPIHTPARPHNVLHSSSIYYSYWCNQACIRCLG